MQTKVVITIDTEPDNLWNPNRRRNLEFKSISNLPKLQQIFDKFSAKPTYLTTFSVAKSSKVSELKEIAKSSNCEIGSHLHAFETPPFVAQIRGDGSYLHQYPFDVQKDKFRNLHNAINEVFGSRSLSYRGGRYSFNKDTISLLFNHGYLVDTSVTPYISWRNDDGSDFKKQTYRDYFIRSEDKPPILEVPVSIQLKSKFSKLSNFLYLNMPIWSHTEGILRRLVNFNIVWLDPSFNTYEDMEGISNILLYEKAPCLNIMFHSSVIIPGGTPYTMTKENTHRFFERLERLLEYLLKRKGLASLTLKEFYEYRQNTKRLS